MGVLDSLFVGLTVYVAAMFKDLQDMIRNIEVDLHKSGDYLDKEHKNILVNFGIFRLDSKERMPFRRQKQLKEFKRKFLQCIVFHNKTLRLVKMVTQVLLMFNTKFKTHSVAWMRFRSAMKLLFSYSTSAAF